MAASANPSAMSPNTAIDAFELLQNMSLQLTAAEARIQDMSSNADVFFLIVNGIIVYFMQCGFAFLECGAVRAKNATNILLKNILDSFIGAIAYWLFGYAFAYGKGNPFLGTSDFALYQLDDGLYATWFFQFVFAATAATIVSGALAERCDFAAYLIYSVLITGFVYPVVTHWAWSDGWLATGMEFEYNNGTSSVTYQDFAGSGVVHLLGGMSALAGAAILGPRQGRFIDGESKVIPGHSVPLAALGGFILFFGFFSFNGGSQLTISAEGDGAVVALAVVNTIISGAFSGIGSMLAYRIVNLIKGSAPKWSLLITVNGGISGMVAICAGCNNFEPWAACVVGTVAGLNYLLWSYIIMKIKVDDPLDAVAVHAGSGIWGVLSVPLFAKGTGIVFGVHKASLMAFAWNLVGVVAISGWALIVCTIMFGLLRLFKIFRIDPEIERKGLDMPKHGEPAYPIHSYGDGWTLQPLEADAYSPNGNAHSYRTSSTLPYSISELPEKDEFPAKDFEQPEQPYKDNDITTVKL